MKILPQNYYAPTDDEMRFVATIGTLATWRSQGRGPRYLKFGRRVLYRGADVLEWIDRHLVETAA